MLISKIIKILVILILVQRISCCGVSAKEIRGAYVTAWTKGFLTRQEADATLEAAKKANLNTLFIQVRKVADSYYESSIEPMGSNLSKDFDPLAYIIPKAHAQGIEIHAWVNVYRVWKKSEKPFSANHIIYTKPDWINVSYSKSTEANEGMYLDPGIPAVREYMQSVIKEIVSKYNVDGIHLDYIRYPGREWGYSQSALAQYGLETYPSPTSPGWLNWRRDQVTAMVRDVQKTINGVNSRIELTAATVCWGGAPDLFSNTSAYNDACQDWKKWLSDGFIDASIPMDYKSETNIKQKKQFRDWLSAFSRWRNGKSVYVAVDVHSNTSDGIKNQIELVKRNGLQGYVLFSFNQVADRSKVVKALARPENISVAKAN